MAQARTDGSVSAADTTTSMYHITEPLDWEQGLSRPGLGHFYPSLIPGCARELRHLLDKVMPRVALDSQTLRLNLKALCFGFCLVLFLK